MQQTIGGSGPAMLATLFDGAIKGFAILAALELALAFTPRLSAATRHLARCAGVVAAGLIPFLALLTPATRAPIWPVNVVRIGGNEIAVRLSMSSPNQSKHALATRAESSPALACADSESRDGSIRIGGSAVRAMQVAWPIGIVVFSSPILIGWAQRRKLLARSEPLRDNNWNFILTHARSKFRLSREVRLFRNQDASAPVTWGTIRPAIVISRAAEEWNEDRKRVVLQHELAHVRRCDFLTQSIAQLICALFWFNPLLWKCAASMRADREQACDDLVLENGCKASDYATHLMEIAAGLRKHTTLGVIAMTRPNGLEKRVVSALDASRSRRAPGVGAMIAIATATLGIAITLAAQKSASSTHNERLRKEQIAHLETFAAQKEKQAEDLASKNNEKIIPEFRTFFAAAKRGDWRTVTNMYAEFHRRHPQYSGTGDLPHTSYWSTILEICLAYYDVTWGEPDHVQLAIDGFMKTIPRGTVYFGGTDPGRGLPTAFSTDHRAADPFFTLTQNALADASYLEYLRATYGDKLSIPTAEDSSAAFASYLKDATERLEQGKLKPDENVKKEDGKISVSGRGAVMEINARLAKVIFDKNPTREFYIEESFPLEWMYPYLAPAKQVMSLSHVPLGGISDGAILVDSDFWTDRVTRLLGTSVSIDGSADEFLRRIENIYVDRKSGVDARYLQNDWAQRAFSKWRSAIAGIYAWRASHPTPGGRPNDKERYARAAERALRQAYLLCPKSPEVANRLCSFLVENGRGADARKIVETSLKIAPEEKSLQDLKTNLGGK